MPPSNVDKARSTGIDLTGILNLGKSVTGSKSTTTTSRAPNIQANLDQLIATLTGAQSGYTKDAAIADNTGAAYRVQQLLQQAMPQINSAQLQSGLYSPTTAQLLQNNLASQITNAELNAQQQQIKDYATIQAQQAQSAASAAQASGQTQTQVTPGVGLEGLLLPMAASMGMQKGYDLIFGGKATTSPSVVGADASIKSLLGGSNISGVKIAPSDVNATTLLKPTSTQVFNTSGELVSASGAGGTLAPVVGPSGYGNIAFSAPDAATWFADDAARMASQGFSWAPSTTGAASTAGAGSSWMSTAGNYASAAMPYAAAALVVDQLTGGQVSKGITSASDVIGLKQPVDNVTNFVSESTEFLDPITDPIGNLFSGVGNVISGKGSVICTALASHGLLSSADLAASNIYRINNLSQVEYEYYLHWATTIAAVLTAIKPAYWSGKLQLIAWGAKQYVAYVTGKAGFGTKVLVKLGLTINKYLANRWASKQAQYAGV